MIRARDSFAGAFQRSYLAGNYASSPQAPGRNVWSIEAIALGLYFTRDAFAGAGRYYLNVFRLDFAWFFPDLVALLCLTAFIYRYILIGRSLIASLLIFYVAFALMLGYIFLGTVAGLSSSFKMFLPIFVGFCFCGRRIDDYPWLMTLIHALFYASILGVVASKFITFPWVGFAYESFGATRQAGRLWWSQSELRLAGFAADSTMASYFILITFVLTAIRSRLWWVLIWGAIGLWTIKMTTNKTSLGVMAIFILALLFVRFFPEVKRFQALRFLVGSSFLCVLIPLVLIIVLSGIDLTKISPGLFSLQDRINNSWQRPFIYMYDLMPIGYITGCGLGCFNYPQNLFSPETAKYYVPVDNFYVGTLLMFGFPFVIFMICVLHSLRRSTDIYKLTVCFVMNIFTVTVLAYGPASGLLMMGFVFSDVFARPTTKKFMSGASTRLRWRQRPAAPAMRPAE